MNDRFFSIVKVYYQKIYRWVGPIANQIKIFHYRMMGIKIGKNCTIHQGVRLRGNVRIGDNVTIGSFTYINTYHDGSVVIKDDVLIGSISHITSGHSQVLIDDHCIFAPAVYISDSTHRIDELHVLTKHAEVISKPVIIHKNVWLGYGVQVMMGVTIGCNSVIGAKAFVNCNIPDNSIAAGIPAQVIKNRGLE